MGSILERISDFFRGMIVGSGLMNGKSRKTFYFADIYALRGKLTAQRVLSHCRVPLFDPGILISKLFPATAKRFTLGLVPHYADQGDMGIKELAQKYPDRVTLIDVKGTPREVSDQISACENIASSSLHGIVTAHSHGIPAAWMKVSDKVHGSGFKFYDYMTAYGAAIEPYDQVLSFEALLRSCREAPASVGAKISEASAAFEEIASLPEGQREISKPRMMGRYIVRRLLRKIVLLTTRGGTATKKYISA